MDTNDVDGPKRAAWIPVELVQALVPWLHLDGTRAVGCLRIEPQRLVATDGHRMAVIAPVPGSTWCGEAFSMPRRLLLDALAVAMAPHAPTRSIEKILADEPGEPVKALELGLHQIGTTRTVDVIFSDKRVVHVSSKYGVDERYPNTDVVMEHADKAPADKPGSIEKFVALNPSFLLHCYQVAKALDHEPGVQMTGWSHDEYSPVYLRTIDKAHRGRFALMAMRTDS